MTRMACFLSFLFLASYPCRAPSDEPPLPPKPEETNGPAAVVDKMVVTDKPFIIYHVNSWSPVILVDDFGIMLINENNEGNNKKPSPRILIAFKSGRTLIDTRDPKIAAMALKMIPKDSRIRWYDTCTMPRSFGLPAVIHEELAKAIKDADLILAQPPNITCYCGPE